MAPRVGMRRLGVCHHRTAPSLEEQLEPRSRGLERTVHDADNLGAERGQRADDRRERLARRRIVALRKTVALLARDVPADHHPVPTATGADADPHRQPGTHRGLRDPSRTLDVHHHFHHEQVAPRLGEGVGHFPVVRGLPLGRWQVRGIGTDGSGQPCQGVRHGTCDRHRPVGRHPVPCLAGELDGAPVDGHRLVAEPRALQHVPAGREGVGGDHVGARFEIGLVHAAHRVGVRPVRHRAPRGGVHLPAETPDLGAGRTVEHDDVAGGELLVENHGAASRPASNLPLASSQARSRHHHTENGVGRSARWVGGACGVANHSCDRGVRPIREAACFPSRNVLGIEGILPSQSRTRRPRSQGCRKWDVHRCDIDRDRRSEPCRSHLAEDDPGEPGATKRLGTPHKGRSPCDSSDGPERARAVPRAPGMPPSLNRARVGGTPLRIRPRKTRGVSGSPRSDRGRPTARRAPASRRT